MSAPPKRAGSLARWLARHAGCSVDEAVERLAASQRARFLLTAAPVELRADAEYELTQRTGVRVAVDDGEPVEVVDPRQLELATMRAARAA